MWGGRWDGEVGRKIGGSGRKARSCEWEVGDSRNVWVGGGRKIGERDEEV